MMVGRTLEWMSRPTTWKYVDVLIITVGMIMIIAAGISGSWVMLTELIGLLLMCILPNFDRLASCSLVNVQVARGTGNEKNSNESESEINLTQQISSSTVADFARDVVARTGGGILADATITPDDVEGLCRFLVAKYAVADTALPDQMSPSSRVDEAWHRLLLYPGVYDVACRRAHATAARMVGNVDEYPGVVDHSPNAANDPPMVKELRRRTAINEMTRLGLISSSSAFASHPLSGQSRAIGSITQEAPLNVLARLYINLRGLGRDKSKEDAKINEAPLEEHVAIEEEAAGGRVGVAIIKEEKVNTGQETTGHLVDTTMEISVKALNGTTTTHRVRPQTVFADFMLQYAEQTGIPVDQQRHIFRGKQLQLERHLTCAEHGLRHNSHLQLILKLRGC